MRQLVARVATRVFQAGVGFTETGGAAGVKQETIGGYSATFTDEVQDVASAIVLNEDDRRIARRFGRGRVGSVQT